MRVKTYVSTRDLGQLLANSKLPWGNKQPHCRSANSLFWIYNEGQKYRGVILTSVSDPYSFFPDPDPEVEAGDQIRIRIRIQSGSRALMTKNWKKITAGKKIKFFFDEKVQFIYP